MNNRIKQLEKQLEEAKKEEAEQNARKRFKCGCGSYHSIKDCEVIQTHWYVRPYGCTGGDYWNQGELKIICPKTGLRNRVLFETIEEVPWDKRNELKYSPERQFRYAYVDLFKKVIEDYEEDKGETYNNYYFDKNWRKFGIEIALPKYS